MVSAASAVQALGLPFSWDTIPVYFHSMNTTGPWNEDALEQIARFPVATVEKSHAGGGDYQYLNDGTKECRRVAGLGTVTRNVFYTNSLIDWPPNPLHQLMVLHPDWRIKDELGEDIEVLPGLWGFNLSVQELREEWIFNCLQAIDLGCDACFVDRSNNFTQVNAKERMSKEDVVRFEEAHMATLKELNGRLLARNSFAINNNQGLIPEGTTFMMIEDFAASDRCVKVLRLAVERGMAVEVHAGDEVDDGSNATEDQCINGDTNAMAAFLIGAGEYSYYHCAAGWSSDPDWPDVPDVWLDWLPEYDRPLGEPLAPGEVDQDGVWHRSFSKGTRVLFDGVLGNGTIIWGDGVQQRGNISHLKPPDFGCYWQSMSLLGEQGVLDLSAIA